MHLETLPMPHTNTATYISSQVNWSGTPSCTTKIKLSCMEMWFWMLYWVHSGICSHLAWFCWSSSFLSPFFASHPFRIVTHLSQDLDYTCNLGQSTWKDSSPHPSSNPGMHFFLFLSIFLFSMFCFSLLMQYINYPSTKPSSDPVESNRFEFWLLVESYLWFFWIHSSQSSNPVLQEGAIGPDELEEWPPELCAKLPQLEWNRFQRRDLCPKCTCWCVTPG
jgi:hypothetical protein